MAGCRRLSRSLFHRWTIRYSLLAAVAGLFALAGSVVQNPGVARADHMMCEMKAERRTQTVFIDTGDPAVTGLRYEDVLAAFERWNALFRRYHGLDIFAPATGEWWEADVLITAAGWNSTWVHTPCSTGFEQRGNNKAIVFIGSNDSWRNRQMLAHELGHALGFADHGAPADHTTDYARYMPCTTRYIGVMSYCAGPQSWFLDRFIEGVVLDGGLVANYWN
jgi:hypothetical protein